MNYPMNPGNLLQAVLESFVDGIIVLTNQQEVLYINKTAEGICNQFSAQPTNQVPTEVMRVCEALVESAEYYPDRPIMIESEVPFGETAFRIRAQWIFLDAIARPCILIRLQDQKQMVQSLAMAEAQKWDLTKRETEVWTLRRFGYKRKQIATKLYIAEDTVKKHLKNIQSKRQCLLDEEEWNATQAS
jgi:DNA-binding CsgD family transcriptional regulator